MANPQSEEGHVDLANEIVEQFCRYRISGEEWMVLWVIIRKTYGWKKKADRIALSQFAHLTGLKRQTVLRAIQKLSSKKIIAVIKNDDSQINSYSFIKDFDKWELSSKKITLSSKKITTVIKKDNLLSSFLGHTKDTITKDTITKERESVILPENINLETWQAYLEMRKAIRKPATKHAQKLIIKKLLTFKDDPNLVLEQSIQNSWQGIFELKGGNYGAGTNRISNGGFGIPKEYIPDRRLLPSDAEIERGFAEIQKIKNAIGQNPVKGGS